ncbi:MAG TPA: hypothetical protein VKU36_03405 [Candidatus Babeliales bacterium]|nr:hypothetical protein [Candidatus Babeliales bacterium]
MINKEKHCCSCMSEFLADERVNIGYYPKFREYFIPLTYKGKIIAIQCIDYCPWCGKKLPDALSDVYYDILKEKYNIDNDMRAEEEGLLPEEFKTDEWWKKRGL